MPTTGTQAARAQAAREKTRGPQAAEARGEHGHDLTVTIPLDRAAELAAAPLSATGRVLSSRGGLPIYVGLAVMAAADVVAWPVAVAAGLGYAALRRWGPSGGGASVPAGRHDAAVTPPGPADG